MDDDEQRFDPAELEAFLGKIFESSGSSPEEAKAVASHLVDANLVGHDSHGVMRAPRYQALVAAGKLVANKRPRLVSDLGASMLFDGRFGYGQIAARDVLAAGAMRASRDGFVLVGLRNSGHLGRIGAWAEFLANRGFLSLHFVNSSGFGILVAPHGGSDRRLSSNPIALGVPLPGADPIILDMATSAIAEGKIQMASNRGELVPDQSIIDGMGQPTNDPSAFYADPPGAILPFGAHKGFGLSLLCEVLAGSLTGGGSSHPTNPTANRLVNNMFSLIVDPRTFVGASPFGKDVLRLAEWVKASPPRTPNGEVLLPGEPEQLTRRERLRRGIPIDSKTWSHLVSAAARVGVTPPPSGRQPF
jgi:hydroxycarboxylate dehydrogenase B